MSNHFTFINHIFTYHELNFIITINMKCTDKRGKKTSTEA